MIRILILIFLIFPLMAFAGSLYEGEADFADDSARILAAELLAAHGGMEQVRQAESLQFSFFTKMLGNPTPFYSFETLDLDQGRAWIDWPFWDATIAWDGKSAWSKNWPMPLPPGFFVRLSSSFLMLPWQLNADETRVRRISDAALPEQDIQFQVLRVTYERQHPGIPGTYYDVYVHPETKLMTGIGFDINHPGMVANPKQPIGPNFHVFGDYRKFGELVFPTFYESWGQGAAEGGEAVAYHFLWDLSLDQPFDAERLIRPADAIEDTVSKQWWQAARTNYGDQAQTLAQGGEK